MLTLVHILFYISIFYFAILIISLGIWIIKGKTPQLSQNDWMGLFTGLVGIFLLNWARNLGMAGLSMTIPLWGILGICFFNCGYISVVLYNIVKNPNFYYWEGFRPWWSRNW